MDLNVYVYNGGSFFKAWNGNSFIDQKTETILRTFKKRVIILNIYNLLQTDNEIKFKNIF